MTQTIGCTVAGTVAFSQGRISENEFTVILDAGQMLSKAFVYAEGGAGTGTFDFALYHADGAVTIANAPRLLYKTAVSFSVPAADGWVEISGFSDDLAAFAGMRVTATLSNTSGFVARTASGVIANSVNARRNGSSTILANPFNDGVSVTSTSDQNSFYVQTEPAATTPTLTTTLVADAADTALPGSTNVNVRVFTATNALVGIGTITTTGVISITDADLTLETGMSLADATTYRVDFQEATGTRQRTVELTT